MRNLGIFCIVSISLLATACQSTSDNPGFSRADRSVFQATDN